MLNLELRLEYTDEGTAKAVFEAIGPDNEGYVQSELRENTISLKIEAETAGTMKNTADDLLACIKIAEEASGLVSSAPAVDPNADVNYE